MAVPNNGGRQARRTRARRQPVSGRGGQQQEGSPHEQGPREGDQRTPELDIGLERSISQNRHPRHHREGEHREKRQRAHGRRSVQYAHRQHDDKRGRHSRHHTAGGQPKAVALLVWREVGPTPADCETDRGTEEHESRDLSQPVRLDSHPGRSRDAQRVV